MKRLLVVLAVGLLAVPALSSADMKGIKSTPRAPPEAPKVAGLPLQAVQIAGGVQNYNGDLSTPVGLGGAWGASADFDATRVADLEVAYGGGVNSINNLGLTDEHHMVTNGLNAALKLNPIEFDNALRPFLLGGIGISRITVPKNVELAQFFRSDTAGAFPLAAGLDMVLGKQFMASARAEYDVEFDNEVLVQQQTTNADRWGFMLNVGVTQF